MDKKKVFTIEDTFKINVFNMVKHHKKYCEGEDCCISLLSLRMMAENAGVKFTKKELELFI